MGLFSFRATFSEVEGDFEGKKVEIARKDNALELDIITKGILGRQKAKETYLLPKDLKGGVDAVDFKDRVTNGRER